MDRFDVAIVGAGPAGSRAAWRLASAGARVAILDGSHPREKPCGGGVTGRALEIVRDSLDLKQIDAVTIEGATFEHGVRQARVSTLGDPHELPRLAVTARRGFDSALLAAATAAGACLVPERVIDVAQDRTGWTIATRGKAIRSDWLLGADGPNSLVRRRVLRPFERADLSVATGFFVHGQTSRDIAIAFEDAPPGYLWSFPRRDHLAVGVCAQADESNAAPLLAVASRWIHDTLRGPMTLERYSWPIPSLRPGTLQREQPAGPGWMLLGDAGGLVDPITREGIFFALMSAEAAADTLLGGGDPAAHYAQRVRGSIHPELIRAARLKARFFNPRFTGLILQGLQRGAAIRDVMSDLIAGRQPYHGLRGRLLRTLDVRLMLRLLFGS
jgi:geranylgeranyl reductase family protein